MNKKILIITFIFIIILAFLLFIFLISNKESKDIDILFDESVNLDNKIIADRIITQVEKAYVLATDDDYPTLEEVKNNFKSKEAIWTSDSIIKSKKFNCDVKIINNNLKVSCLNFETSDVLTLTN